MYQVTINRLTREEVETNTKLLIEFVALFTAKNHQDLLKLFHPKGRFFNIPARATLDGYFFEVLNTRYGVSQHFCMHVVIRRSRSFSFYSHRSMILFLQVPGYLFPNVIGR
jgi:hypothetical protein